MARRTVRRAATAAGAAAAVTISLAAVPPAADAAAPKGSALPAKAQQQIAALQKLKTAQTKSERKLDSRLSVTVQQRRSRSATTATPKLQTGVTVAKNGTTDVDISVTKVSTGLLTRLRSIGATVPYASKRLSTVRAAVPVAQLPTVAGWSEVRRVSVASGAITAREDHPTRNRAAAPSKGERAARVEKRLKQALATPRSEQGTVVSEGDKAQAADKARAATKVRGAGVKVCVLSDGVDSLAASQAAGELPAVDVLPGQAGSGDEGTAMLEIVHDIAPTADLGFASAFISDASFADNIRALRFDGDCDVIVDDVLYYNEDPFQDGPIAQSVDAVTADGALYFSSAGNEGNTIDKTTGNYEGDFVDSGKSVGKFAGSAHDFDPGAGTQVFEPLSDASSAGVPVTLFWADPLGKASDDYDLYLFDASNNVVSFSQDTQDGTQDPFEILQTPIFGGTGLRLAVVKFSGAARYFQVSALRGRYSDSKDGLKAYTTPGITRGHSAAKNAFSIAAAPAAKPLPFDLEPGDPANPSGPYPNAYTKSQLPERFTSDGPRRVFFNADGSPITPGNTTSTGGAVRQKPDYTAADGVTTSVPDFAPFFGTSAAAPNAAAIAALVLSGNVGATEADVREAYSATALDLAPAGVDTRTGHGILRADKVLAYTGATAQPIVTVETPTLTPTTGDGDAYLEPGESATANVPARNIGDGTATGVSVRLTSPDAGVTITPRSRTYPSIAADKSASRPFTITLAPNYPLGKPVRLDAKITFAGALSPRTATVRVPTGQPSATAKDFAYSGAPVAIPDDDEAGASVSIPVSGVGYASKLTFSVDGATCSTATAATTVGIDHTYVADLTATLTAPNGQKVQVFSGGGSSGNNMCKVVFDDSATKSFATATAAQAPFTGTWRPDEPLGGLTTDPVDGAWKLTVVDDSAGDSGSIRAVSLHVNGFVPNG